MKRLKFIGKIVIILLAAGVAAFFIRRTKEPSYQGRSVTQWLKKLYQDSGAAHPGPYLSTSWVSLKCGLGGGMPERPDAESMAALKEIGTNAVPVLLKLISKTDGKLTSGLKNLINRQTLFKMRVATAADDRQMGETGFVFLGADAKAAIPELLKLTKSREAIVRGSALYCLAAVQASNEVFLPVLQQELHDANPGVQAEAAFLIVKRSEHEAERLGIFTNHPYLKNIETEDIHSSVIITAPINQK